MAWGAVAGRPQELAAAVGGRARCLFPPGGRRPPVPLRWALSACATALHVVRRRPRVLVVTNPPCPAALVGWAAGRALGAAVVLDSHPGAFGAQGDRVARALRPLHRFVTRHADLSIVADESWARVVRGWGADAVVVHESPARWTFAPSGRHRRLRALYVGRFARDEPWGAVLGAAAELPGVDVLVTGDHRGVPIDRAALAPNVRLTGYLGPDDYRRAVYDADCVVTLTTDGGSVMRAACEAVWAGRPLVVSDWPVARAAFPHALHVDNTAGSLAAALRILDARYDEVAAGSGAAHALQSARWDAQLAALLERLGPRHRTG